MTRILILAVLAIGIVVLNAFPLWAGGRTVLTEAKVRQVVTEYLAQRTENQGIEIRLRKVSYAGETVLPPGDVSFEVVAPSEWEGWGKSSLAFIVRVDDKVAKNITLNVEVEAMANVVVATRHLDFGMVVTSGDVAVQKRDLATAPNRVCRNVDEVIGKRVKVGMRVNSPIRGDYLEKPPLVKSGQMVTIIAENRAFRVTATGRARGNGAEGDLVMVQNLNAQKDIPTVVVGDSLVRVDF
jgi:flagella basal body P-ring formation protein FlgA